MVKEKDRIPIDKKVLSFFLLVFPSLLVAVVGIIGEQTLINAVVQIALVFYQSVLLKQFLDKYYSVM